MIEKLLYLVVILCLTIIWISLMFSIYKMLYPKYNEQAQIMRETYFKDERGE